MTRKAIVSLVIYESVEIEIPNDYPTNIDNFSSEQTFFVEKSAREKIYNQTGISGWEVEIGWKLEGVTTDND